jgi:hypothetical protein
MSWIVEDNAQHEGSRPTSLATGDARPPRGLTAW